MVRSIVLAFVLAGLAGCSSEPPGPVPGPDAGDDPPDVGSTCGDGSCVLGDEETCESCPVDCGACGACGDGRCDLGVENCAECAQDCGACGECGDGACVEADGENCGSCAQDCGACPGCGDGACDLAGGEDCASCPGDCGACNPCGDGTCDAATETCASCAEDCGRCDPCGDGACDEAREDCQTCAADCGACGVRTGCVQGKFHAYFGNLHAHTSFSDGAGFPGEAFAHARTAGLDFQYVTDHREMLKASEWTTCRNAANTADVPGTFVAGCGYEFNVFATDGSRRGHLNVLFPDKLIAKPTGLDALYTALAGCSPCLGQWNHPPWPGTFSSYQFFAQGKPAMRLMEFSGHGEWADKWKAYFGALGNGWVFSPSNNEDNHSRNWGDSQRATGVWASELSRTALREAVLARRTFATQDDTAWIKMKADGACWMGSVLHGLGEITLEVVAQDRQAGDGFKRIDLYGTLGQVLDSKSCNGANPCTATFVRKPVEAVFWAAKATQSDGDVLVSAPIWVKP